MCGRRTIGKKRRYEGVCVSKRRIRLSIDGIPGCDVEGERNQAGDLRRTVIEREKSEGWSRVGINAFYPYVYGTNHHSTISCERKLVGNVSNLDLRIIIWSYCNST